MAFTIPSFHYLITMCLFTQSVLIFRPSEASKDIGFKRQVFDNTVAEIECCKCKEKIKINPFDMLNYVHGAKTMRDEVNKDSYLNDNSCPEPDTIQIQTKLYLQRFINLLLIASGLKDLHLDSGYKVVSMEFNITHKELKLMQEYANTGGEKLEKIDAVLSKVLRKKNVKTVHKGNGFFADFDTVYYSKVIWTTLVALPVDYPLIIIVLFVGVVFIVTVRHMSHYSLFYSMVLMLFIIFSTGFGWNWLRMIKEEEAKLASIYALHLNQLPLHCRPHDMTWYQRIWYHSYEKDCEKYFKEISIDPSVRVSPTLVLSETITMVLLHPAGKIGAAFGDFLAALIDPIPLAHKWYLVPLLLVLLFVTVFFTYVVLIGGVISFKTLVGSFEIGYRAPRTVLPPIEDYRQQRPMIQSVPHVESERRRIEEERGGRITPVNGRGGGSTSVDDGERGGTTNLDQGGDRGEGMSGGRRRSGESGAERRFGERGGDEENDRGGSGGTPRSRGRMEQRNERGAGEECDEGRWIEKEEGIARRRDEEIGDKCERARRDEREGRVVEVKRDSKEEEEKEEEGGGANGRSRDEEGSVGRNGEERRRDKVGGYARKLNKEESSVANSGQKGEEEEEDDNFHSNFSPRAFKELKSIYKRFRTIIIVAGEEESGSSGSVPDNRSNISGVEELDSNVETHNKTEEKKTR